MKRSFPFALVLFLLAAACSDEKIDSQRVRDEMRSRKVVRATEGQLAEGAMKLGQSRVRELQTAWEAQLRGALAAAAPADTLGACRLGSLTDAYAPDLNVRRASLHPIRPEHRPQGKEKTLAEAYEYNLSEGGERPPNVQKVDTRGQQWLFTAPIVFDPQLCRKCHGQSADSAVQAALLARYSQLDTAGLSQPTERLTALWSLTIDRQAILQFVSQGR